MSYVSHKSTSTYALPEHIKKGFWLQTKRLSKTSTNTCPETGPSCRTGLLVSEEQTLESTCPQEQSLETLVRFIPFLFEPVLQHSR
jgi:hypothetical protein